jgi:D-beta-D-heptose 7-phosphate kinase/D-beta-D-heptose 1-phosphate adenosyltransferase
MNIGSETLNAPLIAALDMLSGARVACVGDIMLDRFIHGQVDRISPEAPIPVLKIGGETAMLGGVGNVLRNLAALGAEAHLVSVIGADEQGAEVTNLAAKEPAAQIFLIEDAARPTSVKSRYIAGGQQLLRTDSEDISVLSAERQAELCTAISKAVDACDALVLSDYGKGILSQGVIAHAIAAASAKNIPILVDPVGRDYERYRGATLLTPNRKELADAASMETGSESEVVAAAQKLIDAHGLGAILGTRGSDGMTMIREPGAPVTLPAVAREVFDVSGAGDTVIAVTAAGLAAGQTLETAIALANAAAGIVVGKVGTATVSRDELQEQLTVVAVRDRSAKIKTDSGLDTQIAQWRRQGLTIGFTNGCFDVVHPGHVSLMAQAAARCDRLVVALNTDASVSALKGPDRPVQDENARARVIASLGDVDAVILFGDETPEALIRRIRPDTLVKGADYSVETVVGAEFVQSYGGQIVLAELEPGHSTTAAIARMVK